MLVLYVGEEGWGGLRLRLPHVIINTLSLNSIQQYKESLKELCKLYRGSDVEEDRLLISSLLTSRIRVIFFKHTKYQTSL